MLRSWVVLVLLCSIASADEVPGVPKLVTAAPSRVQVDQGKKLNVEGLTLHRAKKLDAAVAKYIEALKADPSNTIARYNLASVLVTKGEAKRALAILKQFQVKSCAFCLQRLRDARADKEWKPLWESSEFKAIVAVGDEPKPTATPGGGPLSPVADVQFEVASDQSDAGPDYQAVPADKVRVHVWDQIEAGFYGSPPLEIVLRNKGGEVGRTPLLPAMTQHRTIEIAIPSAGWWVIDVLDAGKVVGSRDVVANETRCLGGARIRTIETRLENSVYASSAMYGGEMAEDDQAMLTFYHHGLNTGDGAAVVEWRRGGKLVTKDTVDLDRELLKDEVAALQSATSADKLNEVCPFGMRKDTLKMPRELSRRAGEVEARIYERDAQAYSVKASWKKGGINAAIVTVTPIATPKSITWETAADPAKAAIATEMRALLRSNVGVEARLQINVARAAKKDTASLAAKYEPYVQVHGAAFTDAELPVPTGGSQPVPRSIAKRRTVPQASLPAISPDGKSIAFDQEREFYMYSGQCSPPAGNTIEFVHVKDADPSPVKDLSKYEPLTCFVDKIPGGYKIVHSDDMMSAEIRDGKGAVLAKLDGSGNGAHTCFAAKQRVLVLMVHWGVGGDCDVVGGWGPMAAKY